MSAILCVSLRRLCRQKENDSTDHSDSNGGKAPQQKPGSVEVTYIVSPEQVIKWSESFDSIMQHSVGRKLFRQYLRQEYSEENLLFWEACNEFREQSALHKDQLGERARQIYENYISILSPKEVSLDSQARETVNKNMIAPTLSTFDEAQLQIYMLMHRDSYPRFLQSNLFKKLLSQAVSGNADADGVASGGGGATELKLTVTVSEKENSGGTPAASGADANAHSPPSATSNRTNAHAHASGSPTSDRDRSHANASACSSNAGTVSKRNSANKCKKQQQH